ncbi:MAG: hypothetical protein ACKN9T_04050 [Candidatus Methylumidiphilus sp.]
MPHETANSPKRLIVDTNVAEYFKDSIHSALSRQKVQAEEDTVFYVVNLLVWFARAENLFPQTADGVVQQPLALTYAEAVEARTPQQRDDALRRLGDVALVVAGLFAASFSRKLVDIDYYIAMGGGAYGALSEQASASVRTRTFRAIFGELSAKFQSFVDVLAEVGDNTAMGSQADVLRLYEIWLRTGSAYAAERLRKQGIEPARAAVGLRHH